LARWGNWYNAAHRDDFVPGTLPFRHREIIAVRCVAPTQLHAEHARKECIAKHLAMTLPDGMSNHLVLAIWNTAMLAAPTPTTTNPVTVMPMTDVQNTTVSCEQSWGHPGATSPQCLEQYRSCADPRELSGRYWLTQFWINQYRPAPTALPPEMQAAVLNLERHIQAFSIPASQDGQDVTNWVGTLQGKQFFLH
jgi:hypothetical protein